MPTLVYLILAAMIGYVFGAIPFGYLLVKISKNRDLRNIGSGRTGGTNSFRAAGLAVGIVTSVLDVLKAACGVWLVRALFADALSPLWLPWAEVFSGIMSVVGHNWSAYIGWKGGAGTGPNVGWAGAIWFPVVPIAFVVVLGILLGVGIASIASLAMSAVIPISFTVLYFAGVSPYDSTLAYIVGGIVTASIIAWALRPNIQRLLQGQERVVGPRARLERRRNRTKQSPE